MIIDLKNNNQYQYKNDFDKRTHRDGLLNHVFVQICIFDSTHKISFLHFSYIEFAQGFK